MRYDMHNKCPSSLFVLVDDIIFVTAKVSLVKWIFFVTLSGANISIIKSWVYQNEKVNTPKKKNVGVSVAKANIVIQ